MRIVAIFFQLPNGRNGKELDFLLLKKNLIKQQPNRNNHIL